MVQQSTNRRRKPHKLSWLSPTVWFRPGAWLSPGAWLRQRDRITTYLETRWVSPSYSGWVLLGLCLFFFAAASNTMAGWLYVMSGIGTALLAVSAWMVRRGLKGLTASRVNSPPVSVGQELMLEVVVSNGDRQAKSLLQLTDPLPPLLGGGQTTPIQMIAPGHNHLWRYYQLAQHRGLYRWDNVQLRTEAPLGLCGYRRRLGIQAKAVVYPRILPLNHCPLIDGLGERQQAQDLHSRSLVATEGLTRSLRPYRWGDPIRMVHWRTSARFGELRVRELENVQSGQDILLAIDSGHVWSALGIDQAGTAPEVPPVKPIDRRSIDSSPIDRIDSFEQAMTALASLYRYASRRYGNIQVWTAHHGLITGERRILEALAMLQPHDIVAVERDRPDIQRPDTACIWLTQNAASLTTLPPGSRWLLWPRPITPPRRPQSTDSNSSKHGSVSLESPLPATPLPGRIIDPHQPLEPQLQNQPN